MVAHGFMSAAALPDPRCLAALNAHAVTRTPVHLLMDATVLHLSQALAQYALSPGATPDMIKACDEIRLAARGLEALFTSGAAAEALLEIADVMVKAWGPILGPRVAAAAGAGDGAQDPPTGHAVAPAA